MFEIDFESQLTEMHGQDHQVHLLVRYPPKVAVSNLVNSLKGVSSGMLRQERPDLAPRYWKGVLWSPSYFAASCGDAPLNMLKSYIQQQNAPRGRLKGKYLNQRYAVICEACKQPYASKALPFS
jgi:putative transposase